MEKRKVRFIRKNGRIIPIRQNNKMSENDKAKRALKRAVAAFAVQMPLGSAVLSSSRPFKNENALKKSLFRYRDLVDKAGLESIFRDPMVLGGQVNLVKKEIRLGTIWGGGEDVLIHELGHLKAARKKYSFNRIHKKIASKILNDKLSTPKFIGLAASSLLTRPYLNLGMEAEASYHAIKAAKKVGGLKRALRATRTLAPAYATYVAGAAGFTYVGKAAYHKAKDLLTKKKKNK